MKKYRKELLLITFGVALFAAFNHLDALGKGLQDLLRMFSPLLLGAAVALLLNVPMRGFERLLSRMDRKGKMKDKVRGALGLTLTLLTTTGVVLLAIRLLWPQFMSAVTGVVNLVSGNMNTILDAAASIGLDPAVVSEKINEVSSWLVENLGGITGTAFSTVTSVFSSAANIIMSVMLAIYVLANKQRVLRQVRRLMHAFVPERWTRRVERAGGMFVTTFSTFLSRQCLEALILGAILFIGMLVFQLPYAVSLSCLTAVMALIPYVGAYLSFFIGVVMLVLMDPTKALVYAVVFLAAQQVEGNVIYPRVVGGSVGLPSYLTLAAVFVGGAVAGIPGMFFIIPIASVCYSLLSELIQRRESRRAAQTTPETSTVSPPKG